MGDKCWVALLLLPVRNTYLVTEEATGSFYKSSPSIYLMVNFAFVGFCKSSLAYV